MKFQIFVLAIGLTFLSAFTKSISKNPGIDEDKRKKISHEIVNNFSSENYEDVRKDFHASLKPVLTVEKLSEVWKNLVSMNGAFESIISTTPALTNGFNQVRVRCKFKNDNATVEVTFNEDDKVVGLFIKP